MSSSTTPRRSKFCARRLTIPTATLTGLTGPSAVAIDSQGNLYVANITGNTVAKFAPGATTPADIVSGLKEPYALAIDGSGNLFVADIGFTPADVKEFAPGATVASSTFTGMFSLPESIAVDGKGNLYVADASTSTVSKFALGYSVNDGNGGKNYTVTLINNTTGVINKAPLTITATTNTKTYDSTPTAMATPLVTGLMGNDTVSTSPEIYSDANAGAGKTLSFTSYTVNDGNGANNYTVTVVNTNTTGMINKAPLTITATRNTKTYDASITAAATPTVSGLRGNDTVTGQAEVYSDSNPGTGKTLSISSFTVNDGNGGNNYTVTTVTNTTGEITR